MQNSIFKATGPIMIGPSSSHTAGAARLGRVARLLAGTNFSHVSFGLHGSFAKTYRGHGTDYALVFGVMGYAEDDERLSQAFELAKEAGLTYDFHEVTLEGMHENTVSMTFRHTGGRTSEIIGSSIGGGQIIITRINGFATELTAQATTLVISQMDRPGVVSEVSAVLARFGINIGVMKLSRSEKGGFAFCLIETDDAIPLAVIAQLNGLRYVLSVQVIEL